jgi:hypothetical protein
MKNKQIAWYGILSVGVFFLAILAGGEYETGGVMFLYFAGLLGFWVFVIWGWVRLIKSND